MIGSFVLAVLIVIAAYLFSHYYYGDVDNLGIPEPLALAPSLPSSQTPVELDFGELSEQVESPPTQLESDITPPEEKGISIEEFLAELSEAEKQTLAKEVTPPRGSLYGLGPYPEIPHDYPDQDVFDRIEQYANAEYGRSSIGHELIERVLIKLWNQGIKVTAATYNEQDGVIPLYDDTVYVKWSELELEDGTTERYLGNYLCHGSLGSYEESVENGTQPSWIKVVPLEGAGIDPYSFLDLP